jgi:5'-nucleotidase
VTRDIVSSKPENHIVRSETIAKKPEQTALIESYDKLSAPIANRPAGSITETLSRVPNAAGESPLGDVIADAQLAATRSEKAGGAAIAFTNPGGVRADIVKKDDGAVSYGDAFAAQPFRNQLVTMTLTGQQLKDALEQQWAEPKRPRVLQVSGGFSYSWDNSKGDGERILAGTMTLNGTKIDPAGRYRVTVNNYLAEGGDGFVAFTQGTDRLTGIYDVDALYEYFRKASPVAPGPANRIARLN